MQSANGKVLLAAALICLALMPGAAAASGEGSARAGPVLFALALLRLAAKAGGPRAGEATNTFSPRRERDFQLSLVVMR